MDWGDFQMNREWSICQENSCKADSVFKVGRYSDLPDHLNLTGKTANLMIRIENKRVDEK